MTQASFPDGASGAPIARTLQGPVRGMADRGTFSFRGIPFAQPPVGDLRWRAPQAPQPWAGVRDGMRFGAAAPQLVLPDSVELGLDEVDEDCLTLNVWTPGTDGARRPVLVWIHGGALLEGSARNPWYDGARLCARGDAVVVTVQYRLGVLGFMHLQDVGDDEFSDSGNVGMLDQVAALRWVRSNIASFGGDPDNVTVFGESAGGASVLMLMAMPAARGLFHKAIAQSPSPQLGRQRERSCAVAREFMALTGASNPRMLQATSLQRLMDAQARLFEGELGINAIWPTAGTAALPLHVVDAAREGRLAPVPLLIGTTLDELRYWTELEGLPLFDRPQGLWQEQLAAVADTRLDAVQRAYAYAEEATADAVRCRHRLQVTGDINFRLPSIRIAEAQVAAGHAVWMYLFSYRSTSDEAPYESAHAMELPFLFGNFDAPLAAGFTGPPLDAQRTLSGQLQDLWVSFGRSGQPQADGIPAWPRYDGSRRATLELNLHSRIVDDPLGAQRRAWEGVPFNGAVPDELAVGRLTFSDR